MTTYIDAEKLLQAVFGNDYDTRGMFANLMPQAFSRDFKTLSTARGCYWSIAAFGPEAQTQKSGGALEVRALVVDDVGTKVPEALVRKLGKPTAIVESSFMNFQWVYRLSKPIPIAEWAAFAEGVKTKIGTDLDHGYNDAVHLYRLPMGVNTKKGGFAVALIELNLGVVLDVDSITPVGSARARATSGGHDGTFKHIRRIVALVPNSTGYHAWIARMYQIWVLAEDKTEGREAWLEFCARWIPPPISAQETEYDPAEKWDRVREGDTDTLGTMLLDDARAANASEFARIMHDEADAAFDDGVVPPGPKRAGITATPYDWTEPDKLPLRDWLYGKILIRKFISMTVAPGGVGKSSLGAVETLSQVTGRDLLGEKPAGKLRVWLWNLEDPHDETKRKIQSAAKHYGIAKADIGDRLFVDSGRDQRLVVAVTERNAPTIVRPVIRALVEQIKLHGIDVVVVDPFVSCHEVPENDNTAQDMVVKEWGRVAEEGNCAVHLVDHTRKSAPGVEVTTESSRGGKAKTDAARVVRVVNRMSEGQAKTWGIIGPWRYFNTFNDKANMAPPADKRDWFYLESVGLGNGGSAAQAFAVGAGVVQGDDVGVVRRWMPPSPQDLVTGANFKAMVDAMGTEEWRKDVQSKEKWIGNAAAKALELDPKNEKNRATIKEVVAQWFKAGLLREVAQIDEHRKVRKFIEIAGGF